MLHDKVYLWMMVASCIALAAAITFGVIEYMDYQDQTIVTTSPF